MGNSMIVRQGTIAEVVILTNQIPEFHAPHGGEEYEKRFKDCQHLILVAEVDHESVGFKAGYQRINDGSFYSWMGGVLPEYRRRGVAEKLAGRQEDWARGNGYRTIRFKTLNRHKGMLLFALSRGFNISAVEPRQSLPEYRIWLEKKL